MKHVQTFLLVLLMLHASTLFAQARSQTTLSLTEAFTVTRALEHSHARVVSRSNEQQAIATRDLATHAFVPQVELSGRYTHLSSIPEEWRTLRDPTAQPGTPGIVFPQQLHQIAFRGSVTLPVTDWLTRAVPTLNAANERVLARRLETQSISDRTALDARIAYLEWLRIHTRIAQAEQARNALSTQIDDAHHRVDIGVLPRVEALALESQLVSQDKLLLELSQSLALAEAQLRTRLGLSEEVQLVVGEPFDIDTTPPLSTLANITAEQRPEVQAIRHEISALDENARTIRAAAFPSLSLGASMDVAAPNPRVFLASELRFLPTFDVSVALSFSPNAAAQIPAQISQIEAQRLALRERHDELVESYREQLDLARSQSRTALQQVDIASRARTIARELRDARSNEFRLGSARAVDIVLAEKELQRAEWEWIDARIGLRLANAQLQALLSQRSEGHE